MKLIQKLLIYDKVNLNGHVYTKERVESMIKDFNHKEDKGFYGSLGYPKSEDFGKIPDNPSHIVEEIHIDEISNSLIGTIEILDTPEGEHLKNIISNDINKFNELFVIRPRGIGNIKEGIVENFQILSFDIISKKDDAFLNL